MQAQRVATTSRRCAAPGPPQLPAVGGGRGGREHDTTALLSKAANDTQLVRADANRRSRNQRLGACQLSVCCCSGAIDLPPHEFADSSCYHARPLQHLRPLKDQLLRPAPRSVLTRPAPTAGSPRRQGQAKICATAPVGKGTSW